MACLIFERSSAAALSRPFASPSAMMSLASLAVMKPFAIHVTWMLIVHLEYGRF